MLKEYDKMIKVVLIEDHALFREGLKKLLTETGKIEIVAEFAQPTHDSFSAFVEQNQVDIVLCDVNLPEMNGIEFSRWIHEAYPLLRVALLSMHKEEMYVLQALENNLDGYFHKDILRHEPLSGLEKMRQGEKYYCQSVQNVIAYFYIAHGHRKAQTPAALLTPREREVIRHISKGFSNREIAEKLGISHRTVDNHRNNIFRKCSLKNTADLVRFAFENGLQA
ncbi:MAG: response regulator transcription factor [Microscillaceae bacterium]|nr:response regulator transcription factor [Microscillaceae bacterium]